MLFISEFLILGFGLIFSADEIEISYAQELQSSGPLKKHSIYTAISLLDFWDLYKHKWIKYEQLNEQANAFTSKKSSESLTS